MLICYFFYYLLHSLLVDDDVSAFSVATATRPDFCRIQLALHRIRMQIPNLEKALQYKKKKSSSRTRHANGIERRSKACNPNASESSGSVEYGSGSLKPASTKQRADHMFIYKSHASGPHVIRQQQKTTDMVIGIGSPDSALVNQESVPTQQLQQQPQKKEQPQQEEQPQQGKQPQQENQPLPSTQETGKRSISSNAFAMVTGEGGMAEEPVHLVGG